MAAPLHIRTVEAFLAHFATIAPAYVWHVDRRGLLRGQGPGHTRASSYCPLSALSERLDRGLRMHHDLRLLIMLAADCAHYGGRSDVADVRHQLCVITKVVTRDEHHGDRNESPEHQSGPDPGPGRPSRPGQVLQ